MRSVRPAAQGPTSSVPELAVTGHPPEDLLLRPGFVKAARASLDEITPPPKGSPRSSAARSSIAIRERVRGAHERELRGVYRKHYLRTTASSRAPVAAAGRELILLRCGDALSARRSARTLAVRPPAPISSLRAADREPIRFGLLRRQGRGSRGDAGHPARDNASYPAFCNLVGGQDDRLRHTCRPRRRGRRDRARLGSRRRCSSSISTRPRIGRRLRDAARARAFSR